MKLPDALAESFRKDNGRDPQLVARALYDIQGNLGTTYVAAADDSVTLYSRPSSGTDSTEVLRWTQITQATVRADSAFAFLEFSTARGPFVLRFSGWDKPALDSLVEQWRRASSARPQPSTGTPAAPAAPQPQLSPLAAFCASLHAMIECDQEVAPAELHFLSSRIPDERTIREGREFLQQAGLDKLCEALPTALNEAQRRCLMANLIGVAMVDGLLRSAEMELLNRFQAALQIAGPDREAMFGALLARNNLAVFPASGSVLPDADGLTPLMAFCAALLAMMEADGSVAREEMELLTLAVPYPDDIRLGQDFMHAYDLDHLLDRLSGVLDAPQQRCLMANLIAVMLADGMVRSSEQALLARFKQALNFGEGDYAALYEALLVKDNLAVFAA